MAAPKIMNGARAIAQVNGKTVGWFTNFNYNVAFDTQDAYLLGRLSAAEIDYVAVEPVNGSMSGWRAIDHGPFADARLPTVQQLLTADYLTLTVMDRITGKRICSITGVRLLGEGGGLAARQLSEVTIPYKGLMKSDESVQNAEPAGSTNLP